MRLFLGTMIVAASATLAAAQQSPPQPTAPVEAKIVAELAAAHGIGAVKNSPLSAEEINESVQTLADGNRIVRNSTGKFYRNSDGRVRREMTGGLGGMMGFTYSMGDGVSIANPAMGQKLLLDSQQKTARIVEIVPGQGVTVVGDPKAVISTTPEQAVKLKAELESKLKSIQPLVMAGQAGGFGGQLAMAPAAGFGYAVGGQSRKYESKSEDLGTRDFEGVSATGTRKVTTIPAGDVGNERPIEIVYERWFSKDLGMVVFSKHSDPRFGDQTYRLTNIVRTEPDPSLFTVPTGYKTFPAPSAYKSYGDATTVYRIATTAAEAEKAAATPKTPTTPKPNQ